MSTAHTATPWEVCKSTPSLIEAVTTTVTGSDDGKRHIAQALEPIPYIGTEEIWANAAFIVRAVNSHDDLKLALKNLLRAVDACNMLPGHALDAICDDSLAFARAALTKAGVA